MKRELKIIGEIILTIITAGVYLEHKCEQERQRKAKSNRHVSNTEIDQVLQRKRNERKEKNHKERLRWEGE